MTVNIEIDELNRSGFVLSLTANEERVLKRAVGMIGAEWQRDNSVRVYSKGNVGSIALSDDTMISITTKLPVSNILYLASLAYKTMRIPSSVGETLLESSRFAIDWLAVLLVTEIEALVNNGLRQDYVTVQDELPYIRGRLQAHYTQVWARPGLSACEFADFILDIPENRVLRATLEVLSTLRLLPWLRVQIEDLLRSFQCVTFAHPTKQLLDECRTSRLYSHYQPALELCRLFLEQTGVELEAGDISAPAYFFPMEKVFEQAVTNFVRSRFLSVSDQSSRFFDAIEGTPLRKVTYVPDIIVGKPPQLVIEIKYARPEVINQFGGLSFDNKHIYQATFYGLSLGRPTILIYPKVDRDINVRFDIEGVSVSIRTLDLEKPGIPDLGVLANEISEFTSSPSRSLIAPGLGT